MLCSLAVRRIMDPDGSGFQFLLRISGKRILGSAGAIGSEEQSFPDQARLIHALRTLEVPENVMAKAEAVMRMEAYTLRFVTVSTDVQISFEHLQNSGYDLFD
jgi:hypothetical protein